MSGLKDIRLSQFGSSSTQLTNGHNSLNEGDDLLYDSPDENQGTASLKGAVFNLCNTILGTGTLSMAYVASKVGIVQYFVLLMLLGLGAHYSIVLLVKDAEEYRLRGMRFSYPELAKEAFGKKGELAASLAIQIQQFGACILYVQFMGQIYAPLFHFLKDSVASEKVFWELLLMCAIVLPLCHLKKLDALKYTSIASLFLIVTLVFFIFGNGVYAAAHRYGSACDGKGCGPLRWYHLDKSFISVLPNVAFSFVCHFNVFPIYKELQSRNVRSMSKVSLASVATCIIVYSLAGVGGYILFLDCTSSDIIQDLPTVGGSDAVVANILRIGFGISVVFSYPLIIWEFRHCLDVMVNGLKPVTLKRTAVLNLAIIIPAVLIAIFVSSVETVFSFVGATSSPMILFILPTAVHLKLKVSQKYPFEWRNFFDGDCKYATAVLIIGLILVPLCLWPSAESVIHASTASVSNSCRECK